MMMPTLRMLSVRPSGSNGAEHFVEAARLEVQLLELQPGARGELGERREYRGARLRQRGEARVALAHFHLRDRWQCRERRARRWQLCGLLELHGDRIVIARAGGEARWSVIGDDASLRDDDRARAHSIDLFENVRGD